MTIEELRARIKENDLLCDELRAWVLDFMTEDVAAADIEAAFAAEVREAIVIADEALASTADENQPAPPMR